MLAAGLDVWTTLNVQHVESLNDVVAGITGVRQQETVPSMSAYRPGVKRASAWWCWTWTSLLP